MIVRHGSYSEETLQEAVRLVQEEGFSYGEAFKATQIPKTTIFGRKDKKGLGKSWYQKKETRGRRKKEKPKNIKGAREKNLRGKKEEEKRVQKLTRIEEKKEKERLLKARKDLKRKEAIEKRIKRRQEMHKNKKKE